MTVCVLKAESRVETLDITREIARFLEMAQQRCEVHSHPRRRTRRRYHRSWPMTVRLGHDEAMEEFAVALHNASEMGIAFLCCREVLVDERVGIKLFWHERDGAFVPAVVRHCTPTHHGHIVGCEFVRP